MAWMLHSPSAGVTWGTISYNCFFKFTPSSKQTKPMQTVLDIGNCNADHMFLESMLSSNFGAILIRAHRLEDAQKLLGENQVDLILINRLLDVDGSEGIEVLQALKADPQTQAIPVMLSKPAWPKTCGSSDVLPDNVRSSNGPRLIRAPVKAPVASISHTASVTVREIDKTFDADVR